MVQAGGEQRGDHLGKHCFGSSSYVALAVLNRAFPHPTFLLLSLYSCLLSDEQHGALLAEGAILVFRVFWWLRWSWNVLSAGGHMI